MPYTPKDLEEIPIYFCQRKGEAWVTVGPSSAKSWRKPRIPLDGREYKCAGTITLRNRLEVRGSFTITTTNFDFIKLDTLYIPVEGIWYRWDEPGLPHALKCSPEECIPFLWKTDKPLDYHIKPPYEIPERLIEK